MGLSDFLRQFTGPLDAFLGNLQVRWSFLRQFMCLLDVFDAIYRFVSKFLVNLQVRWLFFRQFTGSLVVF